MRITGGIARGITLQTPKGDRTRPATDGMRQAVFSSLAARVPGARFVDLFAGSGGYGLEAFSRGAAGGVFVEKDNRACACIARNIEAVARSVKRDPSAMRVLASDVLAWTPHAGGLPPPPPPGDSAGPDLIFIDPPYEIIPEIGLRLFARMDEGRWFDDAAGQGGGGGADPVVVFEMPGEIELKPPGWVCVKRLGGKGAHQPSVCFFRRAVWFDEKTTPAPRRD
ncbi:RsmD family RNA methyltransferase [Geminisphaera colitermitum]|uniref:RsmD family RNA methyltransferase n=1 Tax=Geminisphaera colitermitum TaxID=1148786 RepID=UPI000196521A|nr:RsmD family RNA methyltransferase [Geminisphaera colitermitum]